MYDTNQGHKHQSHGRVESSRAPGLALTHPMAIGTGFSFWSPLPGSTPREDQPFDPARCSHSVVGRLSMLLTELAKSAEQDEKNAVRRATDDPTALAYIQSYHWMRTIIGALGIALPIMLLIGEIFLDDATIGKRGSLSAYYHSGMRDAFVIVLAAVGILLISYKIAERNFDFWVTCIAGIVAIGVAIVPTQRPAGIQTVLTPLQRKLTEATAEQIHFGCAAVFIFLLMWICFDFARRELDPAHHLDAHNPRRSAEFWHRFHRLMGWLIAAAIGFIILMWLLEKSGVDKEAFLIKQKLFIGESVAAVAFGVSWLAEGLDWDVLRHKVSADQAAMPAGPSHLPPIDPARTG